MMLILRYAFGIIPKAEKKQRLFLSPPNPGKPEPIPNSEIRNSKQIQMTKGDNLKRRW
jgi:hypothetical protein